MDMILHAEHGSNASLHGGVVPAPDRQPARRDASAIAALSAPRMAGRRKRDAHGPGDRRCCRAADYVRRKRANKEAIMGFGHRFYRAEDPRARHMRAGVEQLSKQWPAAVVPDLRRWWRR